MTVTVTNSQKYKQKTIICPPAFLDCWNTEKRYPSGVLIKVNVCSCMFLCVFACVVCVCCMPLTEAHNC